MDITLKVLKTVGWLVGSIFAGTAMMASLHYAIDLWAPKS